MICGLSNNVLRSDKMEKMKQGYCETNQNSKVSQTSDITILIYDGMDRTGGIQSIVIRTLTKLSTEDRQAFVVCDAMQPALGIDRDRIINVNQKPNEIAKQIIKLSKEENLTLNLVAFAPNAGPLAYLIQQYVKRHCDHLNPRLALCILHPRDLMREQEHKHVHLLNKLMALAIDTRNLVFMNEQCRMSHEQFLGRDLSQSPIVPVPIDSRRRVWQSRSQRGSVNIVAVGRIVPFKAYNFVLPKILSNLRSRGFLVECDIYGYGTHEKELTKLIRDQKSECFIRFHGAMDFEAFDTITPNHDLFVGMGTAALQAAQLGVPTILAIDNDAHGVQGYLYDAPFGNLGEADDTVIRRTLSEMIEGFIKMTDEERLQVSNRCETAANMYLIGNYVEQLTEKSVVRSGLLGLMAASYSRFYLWMARDNSLRRSVRLAKRIRLVKNWTK